MEKEIRCGFIFKIRIFNNFYFIVFYKFLLFLDVIINKRDILVNYNYFKKNCNEFIFDVKFILCNLKYFKVRKRIYKKFIIF